MLKVENVNVIYDGITIVKDISFELSPSETLCLTGKSGSGKTTLLSVITGMKTPTSGKVTLDGKDIRKYRDLRKNRIAYVPTSFGLLPSLTVYENLSIVNNNPFCSISYEDNDRIINLLEELEIKDCMCKYPEFLSSGEYKRVSVARALCSKASYIIFDEPTSNLDNRSANIIADKILNINDKGVIIATHDKRLMKGNIMCLER